MLETKWDFAYDGDGTRMSTLVTPYDESGLPLTASFTSYYFGGAYETRSDGGIFKYYSFEGQTIVNEYKSATSTWELSYLLSDHLGSIVAVTDGTGDLISQQRYLPFGGERTNVGTISQTDYGYTGQRDLDPSTGSGQNMGLMDYKARFYSPLLGRFTQPDTITPGGPQGLNRYSYVQNRPVNFSDPTGHKACDYEDKNESCKSLTNNDYKQLYKKELKNKFHWDVDDKFSLKELEEIYKTGDSILSYANSITGNRGLNWMREYLGNINFWKKSSSSNSVNYSLPGGNIFLESNWLNHSTPGHWLTHELGHAWDLKTSYSYLAIGGVGDALNQDIGGTITDNTGHTLCRFCNPGYPKEGGQVQRDSHIPTNMAFGSSAHNGYGNGATSDYLAEAFAYSVYGNSANIPSGVESWIANEIKSQANSLNQ